MTVQAYQAFARQWIDAWNSRDLDRVLDLYDDGAEMVSAGVVRLEINTEGRVAGKAQLRAYWSQALEKLPNLRFELLDVSVSPDSIVVRYRNERGQTICEYLRLNGAGRIIQGSANHVLA
ncbi:MAG: nuclear transport factor 2 family protein [Rhodospirillaceae bacterium]|nr:nuclear transport factor 2 family protein [Rhodospirillaceae bacterium]